MGYYGSTGEPLQYDPQFHGPVKKRSCTDLICLFGFLAFIGGWIIIASFAIKYGNPEQIIYPTDSYGRICGRGDLKDKPYLFFFNILKCAKLGSFTNGCDTPQVCVEKCPNYTHTYSNLRKPEVFQKLTAAQKADIKSKLICIHDVNITQRPTGDIPQLFKTKKCAVIYFTSKGLAGRCIPTALRKLPGKGIVDDNNNSVIDENGVRIKPKAMIKASKGLAFLLNARSIGEKIFQDLSSTWRYVLVGLVVAMVVSFTWILLLQLVAGIMVWFSMVAMVALMGLGTFLSVQQYIVLNAKSSEELDDEETFELEEKLDIDITAIFTVNLDSYLANKNVWLFLSIVCGVTLTILTLTLCFLRKRVTIAITLIKEASKAIYYAKSALLFPVFPYVLKFLVIVFWGFTAILISASGRKQYRIMNVNGSDHGKYCDPFEFNKTHPNYNGTGAQCLFSNYYQEVMAYAQLYNFFGLLWMLFFISGMCQVILAGTFASYYWALSKPKDIPSFPVLTGTYHAIRYHMGSVALGSLLLATVRFIRIIIEYIDNKCRQYANNPVAKSIICLCRCCFWCLESFLKFINTNAYIMIAVYGKSFCFSAREAFLLLMRNIVRVVVLDKVADFLLFLGKLVVTAFMGILSFYYFTRKFDFVEAPDLNYYWVPIVAICLGTYLIASSFFAVYDMAVDTIFLCFLEDCERNDGTPSKPYHMSKQLMEILRYKNKLESRTDINADPALPHID